jgi:trehalose 6-phosphate phosphatase
MTIALSGEHRFDEPAAVAEAVLSLPAPLLLCTDIDGTLSNIASRPSEARLVAGADHALRALSRTGVEVAVVSGRSMAELIRQFELPRTLHLVGSHGVEWEQSTPRTEHETELLDRVDAALDQIAGQHPGAEVERKPFASALHVRLCTPAEAADALQAAHGAIDPIDGVNVIEGHMVYEVALRAMTKVDALHHLRTRIDPASVVYVGDDQSDELVFESFAALGPDARERTLGIKVGPGHTSATYRLRTPDEVVAFLQSLIGLIDD